MESGKKVTHGRVGVDHAVNNQCFFLLGSRDHVSISVAIAGCIPETKARC
jgi:hypothetical protein